MITDAQVEEWTQQARRDDWHRTFVGSDIRQMLAEIVRLRAALAAAQDAGGNKMKCPTCGGGISENSYRDGYAAGLEAAATYHDKQKIECIEKQLFVFAERHGVAADAIRHLAVYRCSNL